MTLTAALLWYAVITLVILTTEILYTYATQGFMYGFSSNRVAPTLTPFGGRLKRTYQNQVESASYVIPALVGASMAGIDGAGVQWAALLIIVGRLAFAVLYLTGIPFVRVPAFMLGTLSALYLAFVALASGVV